MRKKSLVRRFIRDQYHHLQPGDAVLGLDLHCAWALRNYGRRRGWEMAQEKQADGTIKLGRIK